MGIYRQGEKDQAARIGRLESYVYDFHGIPPERDDSGGGGGGGTTPPGGGDGGGGGTPPPGGGLPPVSPPPVAGDTPIISDGSVPFIGDVFFLKSIYLSTPNENIIFTDNTGGSQFIGGYGISGVGQWGMGRLTEDDNTVSIVNETGSQRSSIELDDDGVVELSDTIKIKDNRPGGSKNTLSLDSSDDVSNVGIEFCNNGVPMWELFKTGKNHLELAMTDISYGTSVPVLEFDDIGNIVFYGKPSSKQEPTLDEDLVTKKFLETYYTPIGGGSGGSVFEPGKPIVARDSLVVKGNGATLIGMTGNLEQYVYGENNAGKKWGVGKTGSTDLDVEFYNDMGTTKTFIKMGDGVITTSSELDVGDSTAKALININTKQTEEAGIILSRSSTVSSSIKDIGGNLVFESISGELSVKVKSGSRLKIERGHGIEYALTTDSGVSRPTKYIIIGTQFFDVLLSKPIWAKSINPTVWIDAFGKIV